MKTLYIFEVLTTREVEDKQIVKNEHGQEVVQISKIKKEIPRRVALRKPTRFLLEEAELYYNVLVSKGIQSGLMSRALLAKRFDNDGGILSDPEKERYARIYYELEQKQIEHGRQSMKTEAQRSEPEKAEFEKLVKSIGLLRRELQELEMRQLSLFDITAENRARTKTIFWWVLHLAYMEVEGKENEWEPIFKGDTYEQKMNSYDVIEEAEDFSDEMKEFYFAASRRLAAATAFWFYGQASEQKHFEELEAQINKDESAPVQPAVLTAEPASAPAVEPEPEAPSQPTS